MTSRLCGRTLAASTVPFSQYTHVPLCLATFLHIQQGFAPVEHAAVEAVQKQDCRRVWIAAGLLVVHADAVDADEAAVWVGQLLWRQRIYMVDTTLILSALGL
jgi:hypothetical protein